MSPASTPTSAPAAALALRGIDRSYGETAVLREVDLVREAPGVIALLGPNGSGKSTLVRIVAQVVEADAGTLEICGRGVEHADDPTARRLVGWAPHEPLAWLDDTVADNLSYAARLAGETKRAAQALTDAAVERWALGEFANQTVRRLSRGWKQRYSLARADLLTPPVLLLDEPTTGLDERAIAVLDDALRGWRTDRVVVVATHDHAWIAQHADQTLDLGSLVPA